MSRVSPATRHYLALDGLRGVAALGVVAFHLSFVLGSLKPASAYLAVDFFFVLSGFVVAHAYDNVLGSRFGWWAFCAKRIVRLYPIYAAGMALAATAALVAVFVLHDADYWTARSLLIAILCAAVMLPSPLPGHVFPLNAAAWSLFFELVANIVYGSKILQRGVWIWLVAALAALGLVAEVWVTGSIDNGATWLHPRWLTLLFGGFRVAYSFPVGLLLYRHRDRLRVPSLDVFTLGGVLTALLWVAPTGVLRPIFDTVFVLVLSPLLVVIGSRCRVRAPRPAALCRLLGSISYPIYALHLPLIEVLVGISRRLALPLRLAWLPLTSLLALSFLVSVALAADRLDRIVRRGLAQRRPST